VAAGPVDDVLAAGGSQGLIVKLAHLERGVAALAEAEIQARVEGDHIKVDLPASEAERVTRALVRKRLYLTELRPEEVSLEAVFPRADRRAPGGHVIALAAGELRRVLARRMVRALALLAVLGIALAGVLTFLNTEAVSSADLAGRRQAADARVAACLAGGSLPQFQGRDAPPPGDRRTENFCRFVVGKVDDPRSSCAASRASCRPRPAAWWWSPGSSAPRSSDRTGRRAP
jgi:hypothetical protein